MEILKVESDRGTLVVQWSDRNSLAHYATMQAGLYFDDISNVDWNSSDRFLPLHSKNFSRWNQERWLQRQNLSVFDVPDNAKIIDIGCGVAISDLLLYSYVPKSTFYLIDKDAEWPNTLPAAEVCYTDNHPHYNSWRVVNDAIETSGFDKSRFNMLSPTDKFPENVDLVMSSFSWCFHYSKEIYWDKVKNSLKTGGKLFLDVRILPDRDFIEEISEEFKSKPNLLPIFKLPNYLDNLPVNELNIMGHRCLWVKNI